MAHASPMGLRLTKQTLNALIDAPGIDAALMIEDRQQVMLLETSDLQEAVAAFRERRDPTYRDQ
jgi:enoyl-CoA hydratase/carnithine racemase